MPTYNDWCCWLWDYLARDRERELVFLSVDDELLEAIGRGRLKPEESAPENFIQCVRARFAPSGRLRIEDALHSSPEELIGLLSLFVLAAHRMQGDQDLGVADTNYSARLKELLGLSASESDAHAGYDRAKVEQIWRRFAEWLVGQGLVPSVRFEAQTHRYLRMTLSQVLLRRGDREKVSRRLARAGGEWERDRLAAWFRREGPNLGRHCADLASERNISRYTEIVEQLYGLASYLHGAATPGARPSIRGGIYRAEDPFDGTIEYRLFPARPPKVGPREEAYIRMTDDTAWERLEPLGPSHYSPLFPIGPLGSGGEWSVNFGGVRSKCVLPRSDFWVLVRDPAEPEGGPWATWGRPCAGEHFRLLVRESTRIPDLLRKWRQEKFIRWDRDPTPADGMNSGDGWIEYHSCQVLDLTNLDDGANSALHSAILPAQTESLHIAGGLRAPGTNAWLEGCLPEVSVIGDEKRFPFTIILRSWNKDSPDLVEDVQSQESRIALPSRSKPGVYDVEAITNTKVVASRTIRIVGWGLDIATNLTQNGEVD